MLSEGLSAFVVPHQADTAGLPTPIKAPLPSAENMFMHELVRLSAPILRGTRSSLSKWPNRVGFEPLASPNAHGDLGSQRPNESSEGAFEELLTSAGIVPRNGVVLRANIKYGHTVIIAMQDHDIDLAVEVYRLAEALPSESADTIGELGVIGYHLVDGQLFEGSEIVVCFMDERVFLLKHLDPRELARAQAFADACGTGEIPGITPFTLFISGQQLLGGSIPTIAPQRPTKHFMIMPKHATALEPLPHLSPPGVLRMWDQLARALDFIHAKGFAHMDIKPGNSEGKICM